MVRESEHKYVKLYFFRKGLICLRPLASPFWALFAVSIQFYVWSSNSVIGQLGGLEASWSEA
jgi:hypothetical protein